MLRNRLITCLTFNEGVLFRTKQFKPDYRYTANFVDAWLVDEIVLLDVTRGSQRGSPAFAGTVAQFATKCFVPLAVGGGVRSITDCERLLKAGADKVVVNTAAFERPEFITEIATRFGSQCAVLSIDAQRCSNGRYEVVLDCGSRSTGVFVEDWARRGQDAGAGEIFITSIERDGSLEGYDNQLNKLVSDAVSIPVIVCGGAGQWEHFVEGFRQGGASAVATSCIYHFTETSLASAKKYLDVAGIAVRLE